MLLNNVVFCPDLLCFQQMHTDVATGQIRAELQDSVNALDQLISELQELNRKLREP